jgi:magnesium-transporting ATPase (P-type)
MLLYVSRILKTSNVQKIKSALQQKHVTVTLVIVMVCFLLCWSPYIVYSCMLLYMDEKDAVPKFLNPIVSAYILHATMVNTNICFFVQFYL